MNSSCRWTESVPTLPPNLNRKERKENHLCFPNVKNKSLRRLCVLRVLSGLGWVGETIDRSTGSGYLEEAAHLRGVKKDFSVLHFDRQGSEVRAFARTADAETVARLVSRAV